MHLLHPIKNSGQTPEGMFVAKYAWMMRWALHFVHNDRTAAEDLVQDAFVRVLLSWNRLHSLHDLDPLLYSHLRYAYLTERRKSRGYATQSLTFIEQDTLAISLSAASSFDHIEVQNELRSILAFFLWRRTSAKFASIFLLRFFHGYYPEEIAAIALISRHSIDLSLRQARAELKTYLMEPRQSDAPERRRVPEFNKPNLPIPAHEFIDELKSIMFGCSRTPCPSSEELTQRYLEFPLRPIACEVLSHISTCKTCLEMVTDVCGVPPPSARSMEDSLGPAGRNKISTDVCSTDDPRQVHILTQSIQRDSRICEQAISSFLTAVNKIYARLQDFMCVALEQTTKMTEEHAVLSRASATIADQLAVFAAAPMQRQDQAGTIKCAHSF